MQFKPVTTTRRFVIQGGFLKSDSVWSPNDLIEIDGQHFLGLSKTDRKLAAFCGRDLAQPHPLRDCKWLDELKLLRNAACNAALEDIIRANDPRGRCDTKCSLRAKIDMVDTLPATVKFDVPGVDGGDPVQFTCTFEQNPHALVKVMADPATMSHIALALNKVDQEECKKRRAKSDRVNLGDNIDYDYNRESAYVKFEDDTGRQRRKYMKCAKGDVEGPLRAKVVGTLVDWLKRGHKKSVESEDDDE